ncbi:hypothetical protein KSD_29720 [Ktedonobacter sp. SOSP1-85]|nr:hypothetical protein KSD_29720 [Ktedonobacter sp. SOSP1-85]
MRTLKDQACQGNRVLHQFNARKRANLKGVSLHDTGIHLDIALRGQAGACACVEVGIIFHCAHSGLNGIQGRAPLLKNAHSDLCRLVAARHTGTDPLQTNGSRPTMNNNCY